MFCPKCGSILLPKAEKGKTILSCSCGYRSKGEEIKFTESAKPKAEIQIGVAEEKEVLPLTDADCTKCGHKKAYHWEVQTRAGDEPPTRFFKCEMCKHTWREYK